jgi:hypothetical protein
MCVLRRRCRFRHTKGHDYAESDSTTLHRTIDALATRLTLSSEEIDELIHSFAPSGSGPPSAAGSSSHSESEDAGEPLESPALPESKPVLPSPQRREEPAVMPTLPFYSTPSPVPQPRAWAGPPAESAFLRQQSGLNQRHPADAWLARPAQQQPAPEPMLSMNFASFSSNLVLPQPTTPSACAPGLQDYFDMPTFYPPPIAAPSDYNPTSDFNSWVHSALGTAYGTLPASKAFLPQRVQV